MSDQYAVRVCLDRIEVYRPNRAGPETYPFATMPHLWQREAALTADQADELGFALIVAAQALRDAMIE